MNLSGDSSKSKNRPEVDPAAASISLLSDEDHDVRKKAIIALADSRYQDPKDSRTFEILENSKLSPKEWDKDELARDIERFPDFDVAYLWAAYPDGNSDHHRNAKEPILLEGLLKAKVKSNILARLSCYHMNRHDSELKSLDYAIAAVFLGDPMDGPGSMVQAVLFLAEALDKVGLNKMATQTRKVKAPYQLGVEEAKNLDYEVKSLCSKYPKEVEWASKILQMKLQTMEQE